MVAPIVHPEYEALKREVANLRDEVAHAIEGLNHLREAKPVLLALYRQKIGELELQCLEAKCRAEWFRRYVEQVRSMQAKALPMDTAAIEDRLNTEMAGFWQKLQDMADENAKAQDVLSHLVPPEKVQAIRQLFRGIVKRLHPDANPEAGDREALLLRRAQAAYERHDLEELEAIAHTLDDMTPERPLPDAQASIQAERDRLMTVLADLRRKIDALEAQSPYNMRGKLKDEAWITGERARREQDLEAWNQKARLFEDQLKELLGDGYARIRFGQN